MQIIRGTTPTITANVRSNIDLSQVDNVWVYVYQQGQVVIDKEDSQVDIDDTAKTIKIILSQEDTLALKANVGALFQIRLLIGDTAYATPATNLTVGEIYKGGIIGGGNL